MVLDDEELDVLADGGTVAGATLDDIDRMTSRELKAALREARETNAAQQRVPTRTRKLTRFPQNWKRNPVSSRLSLTEEVEENCGRK